MQDAQWNAEERNSICGCLWLLVGAWQVMHVRASASQFLPHNSAASQLFVLLYMQMDVCLKKQIGTLFVWVGALEGFFGGGVRGFQPENHTCLSKLFFLATPAGAKKTALHP